MPVSIEKSIFGRCHILGLKFLYIFHKTGFVTGYFIDNAPFFLLYYKQYLTFSLLGAKEKRI